MRIKDHIAYAAIIFLESEYKFKISKKNYLTCECALADIIQNELNVYLNYDKDLGEFTKWAGVQY